MILPSDDRNLLWAKMLKPSLKAAQEFKENGDLHKLQHLSVRLCSHCMHTSWNPRYPVRLIKLRGIIRKLYGTVQCQMSCILLLLEMLKGMVQVLAQGVTRITSKAWNSIILSFERANMLL